MTGIQWTDTVWNPSTGCDRVSDGCDNCYALKMAARLKGMGQAKYQRDGDPRTSGPGFGLTVHPDTLDLPLRWRKPRRIFVNSMSDLFHSDVPDGFIAAVWFVMGQCAGCIPEQYRDHVFQILTKRHARMRSWLKKWADTGDPDIPPMDKAALRCGRAELIEQAQEFIGLVIRAYHLSQDANPGDLRIQADREAREEILVKYWDEYQAAVTRHMRPLVERTIGDLPEELKLLVLDALARYDQAVTTPGSAP